MEQSPQLNAEERLAALLNQSQGVRRHGAAFLAFAEAVGHLTALRDPELFERSLVGTWPTMDVLVSDYITQSGLDEQVALQVPPSLRPYVGIKPEMVAANLRQELLVLDVDERVWVFDAQPVVKTTVSERKQEAHNDGQ